MNEELQKQEAEKTELTQQQVPESQAEQSQGEENPETQAFPMSTVIIPSTPMLQLVPFE